MKIKIASKIALGTFFTAGVGIALFAFIYYKQTFNLFQANLQYSLSQNLELQAQDIYSNIDSLKENMLLIANNEAIKGIIRASHNEFGYDEMENSSIRNWEVRLTKLFKIILEQKPEYLNIKLLKYKGSIKELVSVQREFDEVRVRSFLANNLPTSKYKSFVDTSKMIYLSKIKLKRINSNIIFPLTPMMTLTYVIYDRDEVFGFIEIAVDVSKVFKFEKLKLDIQKESLVTNCDGFYLYHKEDEKTFGWELNKLDSLLQNDFRVSSFLTTTAQNISQFIEQTDKTFVAKKVYLDDKNFIIIAKTASSSFFEKESTKFLDELLFYIFLITVAIAFTSAIITRMITSPIVQITTIAKRIAKNSDEQVDFNIKSRDEIGELSRSLKIMVQRVLDSKRKLRSFADNLEIEIENKTFELRKLNENLESKVKNNVEEIRHKDNLLLQQSKMAAMGEMIGAIAHQWRQPINVLALNIQTLDDDFEDGEVTENYVENFIDENLDLIEFMSKTIDDFRNFFKVNRNKETFDVKEPILQIISIFKVQLETHNISVEFDQNSLIVDGFRSEFQQVILNIINNAKDAILENIDTQKTAGVITIEINQNGIITISDNGGGIPEEILNRIFEPYFTTKEDNKGTGVGLYMSIMIIEDNMNGKLKVENDEEGAIFTIELKPVNTQA